MPLVALIDEKIMCMHGGISNSMREFKDIENLPKPSETLSRLEPGTNKYHPVESGWAVIATAPSEPKSRLFKGLLF